MKINKKLKEYLRQLEYNFFYIKSLVDQVSIYHEWIEEKTPKTIEIGSFFYKLTIFSFHRIVTLELYKMLSKNEDRSLFHWLEQVKMNAKVMKPRLERNEEVTNKKLEDYRRVIEKNIEKLNCFEDKIDILKSLRDKSFAHSDKTYFENREKLKIDYPINWSDFNNILKAIGEILNEQHSLIFQEDFSMNIQTNQDIENILKYCRAFQRVWDNQKIFDLGIRIGSFRSDNYNHNKIMMKDTKKQRGFMTLLELIQNRKSIRKYENREIEEQELQDILEAGRLAPSWQNKQCWQYVVVRDKELIKKLALKSGVISKTNFFIKDAPVVIVACAHPDKSGHMNDNDYYLVDVGISFQQMMLVAAEKGIGSCWLGAFNEKKIKEILNIPEKIKIVALSPFGYPAKKQGIYAKAVKMFAGSKKRKPLDEMVHYDKW